MKYNIPTLMALCQDTGVACNWTGHVKDCKLLRYGNPSNSKSTSRNPEPSRKRSASKFAASSRPPRPSEPTFKSQNRPKTAKRKTTQKPLTTTDAGFARFLKEHSSPKHQRVTAGGRIVPMETRHDSIQEENNPGEWKQSSQPWIPHSPSNESSPANIISTNCPQKNPASFAVKDQVHNGGGLHQVSMTAPQIPVTISMPVQSFLSSVFQQQSMTAYQTPDESQQMESDYFQVLSMNQDLNFHPADIFRSKLNQILNIVNGIEDATIIEFKTHTRFLLDLIGRPVDSIGVEYLIYLHEQMETALNSASRNLQSVDAEIALHSASSPLHVGIRIRWKMIRSEIFDRLEEIKLGLGEALDRFDGVASVTSSINKALWPENTRVEPLVICSVPVTPHGPEFRSEDPLTQAQTGSDRCLIDGNPRAIKYSTPSTSDLEYAFHPHLFETREPIEHPAPEIAGRFDGIGPELYDDGDLNQSDEDTETLGVGDMQNDGTSRDDSSLEHGLSSLSILPQESASEDNPASLSKLTSSAEFPRNTENIEKNHQVPHTSGQADGVVEIRIPRFLPPNMRRRASQTLPRNFPRRFSPLASGRRPSSRHAIWQALGSRSSLSDLSIGADFDEDSQSDDYGKPATPKDYNHSEHGLAALPSESRYLGLSSDSQSNQSDDLSTRDVDYDADIDLPQDPIHETASILDRQPEQTKAIRAQLRAMRGIGQPGMPIGRPTVKTFAITAVGLPGHFQDETGWMGMALKKLLP